MDIKASAKTPSSPFLSYSDPHSAILMAISAVFVEKGTFVTIGGPFFEMRDLTGEEKTLSLFLKLKV